MTDRVVPVIDALTVADLPRCADIEQVLFAVDSPWPLQGFIGELRAAYNTYFAARPAPGAPVVGYAGISVLGPVGHHECEVHTIGVEPGHQGLGYGRGLLEAMLQVADAARAPVFLEVRTDNDSAIALYQRNGFETKGVRKNYYQPSGADAFTMVRAARAHTDQAEGPANS